jgi:predicted transcriptional regulator of viral defense system
LRTILERRGTVLVGAVQAGHGARVSGLERSLLDGAARMDLIGGANVLAEALSAAQPDSRIAIKRWARRFAVAPARIEYIAPAMRWRRRQPRQLR